MKKYPRRLLTGSVVLVALALAPAASASAATIFVGKSGSGGGSCSKPNFKNIAAAVNAASANDTIHICKGTWTGASNRGIQFAKPLKFVGDGPGNTIIDAGGQDYIFNGTSGAITVKEMTLKDGNSASDNGGAIWAEDGPSNTPYNATVDHVTFKGNHAQDAGSAIYGDNVEVSDSSFLSNTTDGSDGTVYGETSALVQRSTFRNNTVGDDGGGVYVDEDGPADYDLIVEDSVFVDNTGPDGYYGGTLCAYNGGAKVLRTSVSGGITGEYGGGLYSDENAVITDSVFEKSTSEYDGGGAYANGDLDVRDSLFTDNDAAGDGGGVYVSGNLTSQDVEYSDNTGGVGGGAAVSGDATSSRDIYSGNTGSGDGGGLAADGAAAILQSSFTGNTGDAGGGAYSGAGATIEQSLFSSNSGGNGGAVYNGGSESTTVENSTLTGNQASNDVSAVRSSGDLVISDSTIADNTGGSIILNSSGGSLTIGNSILKGPGGCGYDAGTVNNDYNVITTDNGCDDFVGSTPAAKVSVAALDLQPLADNGGPTKTRAIKPTSAAANTGDPGCPDVDQRNWTRTGACDSGAFGIGALAPQPTIAKQGAAGAKSLKVRVNCLGGEPCSILVTGKLKGGKGKLEPRVVNVPEGETRGIVVTLHYTKKLARELADKGGKQTIRVTAHRIYGSSRSVDVPWKGPEPSPVTG